MKIYMRAFFCKNVLEQ